MTETTRTTKPTRNSKYKETFTCSHCQRSISKRKRPQWAVCERKHLNPIHNVCAKDIEHCRHPACMPMPNSSSLVAVPRENKLHPTSTTTAIDFFLSDPSHLNTISEMQLEQARATAKAFATKRTNDSIAEQSQMRYREAYSKFEDEAERQEIGEFYMSFSFHDAGVRAMDGKVAEWHALRAKHVCVYCVRTRQECICPEWKK